MSERTYYVALRDADHPEDGIRWRYDRSGRGGFEALACDVYRVDCGVWLALLWGWPGCDEGSPYGGEPTHYVEPGIYAVISHDRMGNASVRTIELKADGSVELDRVNPGDYEGYDYDSFGQPCFGN